MQVFLLSGILAISLCTSQTAVCDLTCDTLGPYERVPDIKNNTFYCLCLPEGNAIRAQCRKCPTVTKFDPQRRLCAASVKVICSAESGSPTTVASETTIEATGSTTDGAGSSTTANPSAICDCPRPVINWSYTICKQTNTIFSIVNNVYLFLMLFFYGLIWNNNQTQVFDCKKRGVIYGFLFCWLTKVNHLSYRKVKFIHVLFNSILWLSLQIMFEWPGRIVE